MNGLSCDRCGKSLLVDEDVRYRVTIEIVAAYDPLEITRDDLARDLDTEIRRTIRDIEKKDAETLESEVHWRAELDACPDCRQAIVENPLGRT